MKKIIFLILLSFIGCSMNSPEKNYEYTLRVTYIKTGDVDTLIVMGTENASISIDTYDRASPVLMVSGTTYCTDVRMVEILSKVKKYEIE